MLKAVYFSVLIQPLPHSFSHSHSASREPPRPQRNGQILLGAADCHPKPGTAIGMISQHAPPYGFEIATDQHRDARLRFDIGTVAFTPQDAT
jgi:hypothetical protein